LGTPPLGVVPAPEVDARPVLELDPPHPARVRAANTPVPINVRLVVPADTLTVPLSGSARDSVSI